MAKAIKNHEQLQTIGRLEKVSFPEFHVKGVLAKVDTGAYRGTLHCHEIDLIKRGGKWLVRFVPLDEQKPQFDGKDFYTDDYKTTYVTSSSGHRQRRYVISTSITLHGNDYPIELTLSKRDNMRYPVLLGRKFLHDKFIVDVNRGEHLSRSRKAGGKRHSRKKARQV